MGVSGGPKRAHTWPNCSLLSNSYYDSHLASSHLFKKKNLNSVNSPSDNEPRWLLDDTHPIQILLARIDDAIIYVIGRENSKIQPWVSGYHYYYREYRSTIAYTRDRPSPL